MYFYVKGVFFCFFVFFGIVNFVCWYPDYGQKNQQQLRYMRVFKSRFYLCRLCQFQVIGPELYTDFLNCSSVTCAVVVHNHWILCVLDVWNFPVVWFIIQKCLSIVFKWMLSSVFGTAILHTKCDVKPNRRKCNVWECVFKT